MITEQNYLKAKQIVQEYESKHLNISAVRCSHSSRERFPNEMEYLDTIRTGGKTIKRYKKYFSGKVEIVEVVL